MMAGIQKERDDFPIKIRQTHVKDVDLADRCESCHLGTREPVTLTKAAMGGGEVFVTHPNRELLKIHHPEKFRSTPCHGGSRVATDSIYQPHGRQPSGLCPLR